MYASSSWRNMTTGRIASNGEKKNEMMVGSTAKRKKRIVDGAYYPCTSRRVGRETTLLGWSSHVGDGVIIGPPKYF